MRIDLVEKMEGHLAVNPNPLIENKGILLTADTNRR